MAIRAKKKDVTPPDGEPIEGQGEVADSTATDSASEPDGSPEGVEESLAELEEAEHIHELALTAITGWETKGLAWQATNFP